MIDYVNHVRVTNCQSITAANVAQSVVGVLYGPLAGLLNSSVLITLPVVGNSLIERIVHVGG